MPDSFNVAELLRQLGIKDVSELPIASGIQPVLTVGGADAITPALLPPSAYCGGALAGTNPTHYPAFRIRPGPSGCFLREFGIGSSASAIAGWHVVPVASALTLVGEAPVNSHNVGPSDVVSLTSTGTVLVAGAVDTAVNPVLSLGFGGTAFFGDQIYIPSGYLFEVTLESVTAVFYMQAFIQDAIPHLSPVG